MKWLVVGDDVNIYDRITHKLIGTGVIRDCSNPEKVVVGLIGHPGTMEVHEEQLVKLTAEDYAS